MTHRLLPLLALALAALSGCLPTGGSRKLPTGETFQQYWYNHGAEISRYELKQARYGSVHKGDAVLIFVTEQFDPVKQVKYEHNTPEVDGAVPILKLNQLRKFVTGVYPYSMMESVFTPIVKPEDALLERMREPYKVTCTSQEWCGHTFTQLNRRDKAWEAQLFSYFQAEGDQTLDFDVVALTEAGIWNRIRLDPVSLPVGEVGMIPDLIYQRLSHSALSPYVANASLNDIADKGLGGEALQAYKVTYPALSRTIEIRFWKAFPHVIEGWTETYPENGKPMTTTARRTHSIMLDYWSKHNPVDRAIRKELGLPEDSTP